MSLRMEQAGPWAAKALLAKVYLTSGELSQAAVLLEDVYANSGYGLHNSWADLFNDNAELNQDEILFAGSVHFGGTGTRIGTGKLFCAQRIFVFCLFRT